MKLPTDTVPYLNYGFVRLIDYMGSDDAIENSARISYKSTKPKQSNQIQLLRYLIRNLHTSPLEMGILTFHMRIPIFIARQLMRHRTWSFNEVSGRYTELEDEFYTPSAQYLRKQSKTNKQGSGEALDQPESYEVDWAMKESFETSYSAYKQVLNKGLARESARLVLPVATFTELYATVDLRNLFHFLKLRLDNHAQQEIQDLANILYGFIQPLFPICCEAFEDYWLNAVSLSSVEQGMIKQCLDLEKLETLIGSCEDLKGSERDEFIAKFLTPQ